MTQTSPLPFPRTWWIQPGRLLGGCYPGDPDPQVADQKLTALLAAGVRRVICLQSADERGHDGKPFVPYAERLQALAAARGESVIWSRHPVPDMGTPTAAEMRAILDAIAQAEGLVYVHCWGGHGRTGTVAGCWLREQGSESEAALRQIAAARAYDAHLRRQESPQTVAQRRMIQDWQAKPAKLAKQATRAKQVSAMPNSPRDDRARGAMLGLAVGDALGTTLEFSSPKPRPWLPPLRGPHASVTGGGPFRLVAGQVTDDTEMAICLARVVADHGANPPQPTTLVELADAYAAWRNVAFDIGGQTSAALRVYAEQRDPGTCGLQAWQSGGSRAAGNGSLMRTAPIGVLVADPGHRQRWAIADALLTHADPRCILAGVAFNAAMAAGISSGDPATMFDAARNALAPGRTLASSQVDLGADAATRWAEAEADLRADLDAAACTDPWLNDEPAVPAVWPQALRQITTDQAERYRLGVTGSRAGFVRVAFRLAFYQLLHAHDWAAGLIDTVNRGGDADTNGAIVGALLGARFGASGIPDGWGQVVLTCDPPAPWDRTGIYHPQAMLALLPSA